MIEKKFDEITVDEMKDLDSFEVDGDYRLVRIDEVEIGFQRLSKEEVQEIIDADDKIQKIREFIDDGNEVWSEIIWR